MNTKGFSKHIFWSYKSNADLPKQIIIKRVIAYGEIPDLLKLSESIPAIDIMHEISNWKEQGRYKKRIYFLKKIILDQ